MSLLSRLESKLGRFAVPHLTVILIAGQVIAYLADAAPHAQGRPSVLENIRLVPDRVLAGQWWRLVTYVFDPPVTNLIFALFFWYLFYLMGTTLESVWGSFRYNVYLAIGCVASVAMAFVAYAATGMPGQVATNGFLYTTVFLAFARLYPDFELLIFFILPVKIKWLALATWIWYLMTLVLSPDWLNKAMVSAAVLNYLLFFGSDIVRNARHGHRRMRFQSRAGKGQRGKQRRRMVHECHVCGLSSETSPKTQFRYCSQCGGDYCYCPEHLHNHEHVGGAWNEQPSLESQESETS